MNSAGPRRAWDHLGRCARVSVLLLSIAVLALTGCTADGGSESTGGATEAAQDLPNLTDCPAFTGQPASGAETLPDLSLPCLDGEGGELILGTAPGVPLVVTLWATWCGPCRDELPLFSQVYAATDREQLLVAGVVTRDGPGLAAEFIVDLRVEFPSGIDENGDLYIAKGLRGLPGTFFVNADGSLAHAELAPIASYEDLTGLIQQHLGVTV
ncbi:MAG: TlpA family protein disulfide reductase [Actinomycetota bacterium]|nr:TlpA family protein disulfide reductase [Actinomycetota bacterium]